MWTKIVWSWIYAFNIFYCSHLLRTTVRGQNTKQNVYHSYSLFLYCYIGVYAVACLVKKNKWDFLTRQAEFTQLVPSNISVTVNIYLSTPDWFNRLMVSIQSSKRIQVWKEKCFFSQLRRGIGISLIVEDAEFNLVSLGLFLREEEKKKLHLLLFPEAEAQRELEYHFWEVKHILNPCLYRYSSSTDKQILTHSARQCWVWGLSALGTCHRM